MKKNSMLKENLYFRWIRKYLYESNVSMRAKTKAIKNVLFT